MRYFEIVKPPARHISANTDPRDAAAGERWKVKREEIGVRNSRKPSDRYAILPDHEPNQSAVTSAAFIAPAFAIAQGSSRPRN